MSLSSPQSRRASEKEIVPVGAPVAGHQIYDANRPMLLDIIRQWGFEPVDLGHVGDDRDLLLLAVELDSILICHDRLRPDVRETPILRPGGFGVNTGRCQVKQS